jgi:uncharacterized protein YegL
MPPTEGIAAIGGQLAHRPLHFIWIVDCSGSMQDGGKIQSLNAAIRAAIPLMRGAAKENPRAEVLVRVLKFSNGAQWHVAQATPVDQFEWTDLTADGTTDLGQALTVVAEQLKMPPMPERALPPVLALVSDGQPTDSFGEGLKAMEAAPWGRKAVRIAVAIGDDADEETLSRFVGNKEFPVLHANNPDMLVKRIKWLSTAVVKHASTGKTDDTGVGSAALPPPPEIPGDTGEWVGDDTLTSPDTSGAPTPVPVPGDDDVF